MLCIHTARALAATARVRSALFCLAAITAEARNGLTLRLLVHELLVFTRQFLDLRLVLLDFCGLSADHGC